MIFSLKVNRKPVSVTTYSRTCYRVRNLLMNCEELLENKPFFENIFAFDLTECIFNVKGSLQSFLGKRLIY